jgi:hypothetical protein
MGRGAEPEAVDEDQSGQHQQLAGPEILTEEGGIPAPEATLAVGAEIRIVRGPGMMVMGAMLGKQPVKREARVERQRQPAGPAVEGGATGR